LETEGVTPEMIARQQEQGELLQTLAQADKETMNQLLEERAEEIDETFFAMLHRLIEVAQQQGNEDQVLRLINLQARLYTETEVGQQLEARQKALRAFQREVQKEENLTPAMLLKHVIQNKDDEETVNALISVGQQAFNYEFFSLLTDKIEEKAKAHEKEEAKVLTQMRQRLLELQQSLQEQSRQILQQATDTLQRILEAEDQEEAIRENIAQIDDAFMYVLSAMTAEAQQQGQLERMKALQDVQNLIMEEAEKQVPPQIRFINNLMRAETEAEKRQLLEENPEMVTAELVQILDALSQELADEQQGADMTAEIQKLKAMVQMRV
jgi:hypothetical protein